MAITKATNSGLVSARYNNISADNYYMEPIASTLVGSGGTSTISFTNIPQIYKHLQVRYIGRTNTGASNQDQLHGQFNSDTSSSYAWHRLIADGAGVYAGASTSQTYINLGTLARNGEPSNVFGVGVIDILDYALSNKNKTTRTLTGEDANSGSDEFVGLYSGLWINTSPITQFNIFSTGASFLQYSRFSLYGIRG
jgi:hypothetical protein